MPLSSGRFPKPDPPHPGTQGRGGVKTWRAFAGFPWACGHLLPAHTQLATFDPTKFELKRGRWVRSSSLRCRSGGGGGGTRKEEQRFMGSRLIKKKNLVMTRQRNTQTLWLLRLSWKRTHCCADETFALDISGKEPKHLALWRHTALKSVKNIKVMSGCH